MQPVRLSLLLFNCFAMQSDVYPDVITAVMRFAESHKLSPAFDGRNVAQPLISSLDAPPSYSQAERALVVSIASQAPVLNK